MRLYILSNNRKRRFNDEKHKSVLGELMDIMMLERKKNTKKKEQSDKEKNYHIKIKDRISTKIIFSIILTILIVVISITTMGYKVISKSVINEANNLLLYNVKDEANKIDKTIIRSESVVKDFGIAVEHLYDPNLAVQDPSYIEEYVEKVELIIKQYVKQMEDVFGLYFEVNPEIAGNKAYDLYYVDEQENGQFIRQQTTTIDDFDPNDPEMDWYYEPIKKGHGIWSELYCEEALQKDMISYTKAVYDEDILLGVVGIDIDFERFKKRILDISFYDTCYAFFLDDDLHYLVHRTREAGKALKQIYPEMATVFKNNVSNFYDYIAQDGIKKKIAFSHLSNGFVLAVGVQEKEILKELIQIKQWVVIILLIGIIMAIFMTSCISRSIIRPIYKIREALLRAGEGDFSVVCDVDSKDCEETRLLVNSFNKTMRQIKVLMHKAREANRLKSEFMSTMSHELRTPLNSIIGFTQLVLTQSKNNLSSKQIKHLQTVERNGHHLLNLINEILDISAIEAGKKYLVLETFNCVELIDEAIEIGLPLARKKQLNLINTSVAKEIFIYSDRQKLLQILINLTGNAIKFTEKGNIKLEVQSILLEDGTSRINIAVSDTGIGIHQDDIQTIFEPFRQVDGSFSRKKGGTGLGLHLTQKLILLLKGSISVRSKVNEGTTFFCSFPEEIKM